MQWVFESMWMRQGQKVMDRTYYLWLAVDEKGLPVFAHLSRRRDA